MTTINIRHNFRLQTYRRTFTNYKKANWTQFTKDTELAFSQTTIPDDIHTANRIFTNIILLADKHNIPKGKMPSTSRLLPEHIVCKITQRDNIRRANPCDPALKPLNLEITSDISLHKQNLWKEHLNANWNHRHNTHTLWKTIHGLSNRAAPTPQNCTITFNKKIATSPKILLIVLRNNLQTPSNTALIRPTDLLIELFISYPNILSLSPQLKSKRQYNIAKTTSQ